MKKSIDTSVDSRVSSTASRPAHGESTAPEKAAVDLVEDTPDEVKADLRKYNRTRIIVEAAIKGLNDITAISSHEQVAEAQLALKEASRVDSLIDKKRLELSKPYRDQVDRINNAAKPIVAPILPAINRVKMLILAFQKSEEERLKKERTEMRKAQLNTLGYNLKDGPSPYYIDSEGFIVSADSIEMYSDTSWVQLLDGHYRGREAKAKERIALLEREKEGAEFFGDDAGAAAIEEQMKEIELPAFGKVYVPAADVEAAKVQGLTKRWKFEVTDINQVPRGYLQLDEKAVRDAIAAGARMIPGLKIFQEESISIR